MAEITDDETYSRINLRMLRNTFWASAS
jgi:hypothetical protein